MRFQTSRVTVAAFCAQISVSVNTFYYWARRVDATATSRKLLSARLASSPAVVAMSDGAWSCLRASSELTTSSSPGGEVRCRINTTVEVSVPTEFLEVIRCLVE